MDNKIPRSEITSQPGSFAPAIGPVLTAYIAWLDRYGETSWDHQSYFSGGYGRWAKSLYYRHPRLGTLAVSPMILSEALLPSARRLFHERVRFPIADAHYAMGFTHLYQATGEGSHLDRAIHFLKVLKDTRAPGFKEYCWGYPFDWATRNGTLPRDTPFITTLPYVFEAFQQVNRLVPRQEWRDIMASIARHAQNDLRDFPVSATASSCGYGPYDDKGGVINAAAYRAFLLTNASQELGIDAYRETALRNLQFVLDAQNPDGSWYYATDGVRDFVDHFHTCFVMKALAKIHTQTGHKPTLEALERGTRYYLSHLFDEDGLPKPFSKAPRMTVYKRELYDCAESINLCVLLHDRIPSAGMKLQEVVNGVLHNWVLPSGHFRARKLVLGWDNVPMHRWGQSQMFRSLALLLSTTASGRNPKG